MEVGSYFDWVTKFFAFEELSFEEGSLPSEEELQLVTVSMLVEVAQAKATLTESQKTSAEQFFEGEYGSQAREAVRAVIASYPIDRQQFALEQLLAFVAVAFNEEQKIRLSAVLIRVLQPEVGEKLVESAILSEFSEGTGISQSLLKQAHSLLKQIMRQ